MLFKQYFSKFIAVLTICTIIGAGLPANAESGTQATQQTALETASTKEATTLIASAGCPDCGFTVLDPIALAGTNHKHKNKALLTDSLWGNLILDMAYQRDKKLAKIVKEMNVVSLGTVGAIGSIAVGTLGQGITALGVLNPHPGHEDSYVPGILGVSLSAATILTFAARTCVNHVLVTQLTNRQIEIREQVETILGHLEHSETKCALAKKQLTDLIGQRACNEWVQLWDSSHQIASNEQPHITLKDPSHISKVMKPKQDGTQITMVTTPDQDNGFGVP